MKDMVAKLLDAELSHYIDRTTIDRLIEIPPSPEMGDFAFPCFSLARGFKKSPVAIAEELMGKLVSKDGFEKITAMSGYLNFFIDKTIFAKKVLEEALDDGYGRSQNALKIVVEFSSPNTNKPLHLGHLRNISIGESVARILQFTGNSVVRASINNDRGVHICKSMLAYMMAGNGETPASSGKKSDHFVGDYYVLFSKNAAQDPSFEKRAQQLLLKWENGDAETRSLWKIMNRWALDGFAQTYDLFGVKFDKEYFESAIYTSGKEIIQDGIDKGIFEKRDDGAIVIDLEEEKLGEKVLLRSDGTSVYMVQDLYLAILKKEQFDYDRSIYVVGNEQEYHFLVLKSIFRKLGYEIADQIHHLSYGMVELPDGKMKSREGTVVDADDLINETKNFAVEEVRERYKLTNDEVESRSLKIAIAAIKYQLLRVDTAKNMLFDPKKAISFDGDTGPYLLYSYARASSILRKSNQPKDDKGLYDDINRSEIMLLKKIAYFPDAVKMAFSKLSPSVIANFSFGLSQAFNEFYHCSPVIGSESEYFRLNLVTAFRKVLKDCLWLLGIEEIEEM